MTKQQVIERLEDLESLDRLARPLAQAVSRLTRPTTAMNALSGTWLGHPLHPVLTDVPIGSRVAATALELFGGPSAKKAAKQLVGLGVLAAAPTALSGWSDWSDTYGAEQRVGLAHALDNLRAVLWRSASYAAERRGHHRRGLLFSFAGLGAMSGTAYLGGHLSYVRGIGVNHTAFEEMPAGSGRTPPASSSWLPASWCALSPAVPRSCRLRALPPRLRRSSRHPQVPAGQPRERTP